MLTQIWLPQSDLGLHCLHRPFCQKLWRTYGTDKAGLPYVLRRLLSAVIGQYKQFYLDDGLVHVTLKLIGIKKNTYITLIPLYPTFI